VKSQIPVAVLVGALVIAKRSASNEEAAPKATRLDDRGWRKDLFNIDVLEIQMYLEPHNKISGDCVSGLKIRRCIRGSHAEGGRTVMVGL
jgi:hypothetical protein